MTKNRQDQSKRQPYSKKLAFIVNKSDAKKKKKNKSGVSLHASVPAGPLQRSGVFKLRGAVEICVGKS